ncbi:MAG TPA: hypothetical protein VG895_04945 [Patescibacteria group bacterium]|nr:hypothetical protein [Patescibacteria group bacterium]
MIFGSKDKPRSGILNGILSGFILGIVLEGFLIINNRTAILSLLSVENAPEPIQNIINRSKQEVINVMKIPADCLK